MKILMSACLLGQKVMYDGRDFLTKYYKQNIIDNPRFEVVHFCPENIVLGTPRSNMLIHGGNGYDVWSGSAKVLDIKGNDLTEKIKEGASRMLEFSINEKPDLIILTDGSDSCGTTVVLDPDLKDENGRYKFKEGPGVAAALLIEKGFNVLGHNNVKDISKFLDIPECTDFSLQN